MENTIFIIHPPFLNFAVYTVHMQSYMLPSHSMGSWSCNSYMCVCLPTCVHAFLHVCVPSYMCACLPTCVRAFLHVCVPSYMCVCVPSYTRVDMRVLPTNTRTLPTKCMKYTCKVATPRNPLLPLKKKSWVN